MSDFLGFSSDRECFLLLALRLPELIQGEPSRRGETLKIFLLYHYNKDEADEVSSISPVSVNDVDPDPHSPFVLDLDPNPQFDTGK